MTLVPSGNGWLRPGDGPPSSRPEIVACEQRILSYTDALLAWMKRSVQWSPDSATRLNLFMMHEGPNPLARVPADRLGDTVKVESLFFDKLDVDANMMMIELIRAGWERRCWRAVYGEISSPHQG